MAANPIPNELRSDHLFLLVGSNPLPDWVAARLLLREQGKLYLVHSDETLPAARQLAKYLMGEPYNYVQPDYVHVNNPYEAGSVYNAIKNKLGQIQRGVVGLNYTGGTKVMSAHSHRALDRELPQGLPPAVFSYLEAATCTMRFDHLQVGFLVGLDAATKLSLIQLFKLHDEGFTLPPPTKKVKAIAAAELLIQAHGHFNGQRAWRDFCEANLKYPRGRPVSRMGKRPGDIKADADAQTVPLSLSGGLTRIADELLKNCPAGSNTLGAVVTGGQWGFKDAEELAGWLDGGWLEHYVTHLIAENKTEYKVDDYGRNVVTRLPRLSLSNPYEFEIDVAAMRGYQLHVFSCYSGSDKKLSKQKLFEAFTRAQQLGGDQSRAAVVCCYDDPLAVEREVAQDWDLKNRVKVFGRNHLQQLGAELQKWFDDGAKEA
jgi:hypothetical protein